jgi:hypothetical protein
MSPALHLTSLVSTYAGAKARQMRGDAMLFGFVCLMVLMASAALFGAFALFVAETYGLINGLLASAGLAIVLGLFAIAVRALVRRRARRRLGAEMASSASALAISSASSAIAGNKATAIFAGLVIGAIAGSMARSGRN